MKIKMTILVFVILMFSANLLASDFSWGPGETRFIPNFVNENMNGYICTKIESKSIYSQMGFQKGDVVIKINGKPMAPPEAGMDNWREFDRVENATVVVERSGKQIILKKQKTERK